MNENPRQTGKIFLIITILLIVVNLGYLNYRILTSVPAKNEVTENIEYKLPESASSGPGYESLLKNNISNKTIENTTDLIKEATVSLTLRVDKLEKNTPVKTETVITNTTTSGVKEYYIPLGSGSASNVDWIDLPGVEAYVAPSNYGKIKEMYFEAGIRIPTNNGRVYARLKNVTDNVGLFESEVSRNGDSSGIVSSGKIPVPTTTKLYRVQLKSSLGALAVLDSGRIKIFVE